MYIEEVLWIHSFPGVVYLYVFLIRIITFTYILKFKVFFFFKETDFFFFLRLDSEDVGVVYLKKYIFDDIFASHRLSGR